MPIFIFARYIYVALLVYTTGLTYSIAQTNSKAQFSAESMASLTDVVNQFLSRDMSSPTLDGGISSNLPCMTDIQRHLDEHLGQIKGNPRSTLYTADRATPENPSFLEMMGQVNQHVAVLSQLLPELNSKMMPPGVLVFSAIETSSDFAQFVGNFTGKKVGDHSENTTQQLRELYDILQPMRLEGGTANGFNHLTIYYGSSNIDGCRGTESGKLVFKRLDYPQIIWEIQHTYLISCTCSGGSASEMKRMNVQITAELVSNLQDPSITDLKFERAGPPEIKLLGAACCGESAAAFIPDNGATSNKRKREKKEEYNVSPSYSPDYNSGKSLGTRIVYQPMLGGKIGASYNKSEVLGLCAGAQFMTPVGNPICNNGSGQFLLGADLTYDRISSGDDFSQYTEERLGIGPQVGITKALGPNVDLIMGFRFPVGLGKNNTKISSSDDLGDYEEEYGDDILSLGASLFAAFSFVVCDNINLQAQMDVASYTNSRIRPGGNEDFERWENDWSVMLNKRSPISVSLNFPLNGARLLPE